MNRLSTFACLVGLCLAPTAASAAGLVAKLPADRAWASFEMTGKRSGGSEEAGPRTVRVRISSVGQSQEAGERCRWIEIKRDEPGRTVIQKILVPEARLTGNHDPLAHVIRGWRKVGDGDPRPLETDELDSRLFLYLPGPLVDVAQVEPQTIESKLGTLQCQVETGRGEFQFAKRKYRGRFTALLNDKPAFGVVRWQGVIDWQEGSNRGESLDFAMTLVDQGQDAHSELPQQN